MKTAALFLVGMYVHLVLSVSIPLGILYWGWGSGWNDGRASLLLFYIGVHFLVHVLGWVSAGASILAYRRWQTGRLLSAWRLLKLGAIPFHLLNYGWSVLVWGAFVAASRGLFFLLLPIPIAVTWLMIVQSGITGWLAIRALREEGEDVFILHSAAQFLPVLDVASTLLLLRRNARTPNP